MPRVNTATFVLVGTTEDPELVIGTGMAASTRPNGSAPNGVISKVGIERTSATSGTQWKVRYFQGWTADPDSLCILEVTIPATANVFDHGAQANSKPVSGPVEYALSYDDFPAGWTDATTPKAGLGLWHSVQQVAGSGNDTVKVYTTTKRRG